MAAGNAAREAALKLSVIIPVYRGESSVNRLVDALAAELAPVYQLEIVLVNDCSPDNSFAECRKAYERHRGIVRFYSLARNVGEHNAVMAGLHKATGDYAVIMDDDFQNPVSDVRLLVNAALEGGYDVVYSYSGKKMHSLFRRAGSWFNDIVAGVMLKKPKGLYLSSFKLLSRFTYTNIIQYNLPFPYIDGVILWTTANIGKVKTGHNPRAHGSSGYTLRKLISLWLNMFLNYSIWPLRFCTLLGFACAVLGMLSFGVILYDQLHTRSIPVLWSVLELSIVMFACILFLSVGIIGEYVGRIFQTQSRRPQFTIRQEFE